MVYWTLIYISCNKKMVLTSEKNIIATSSAELFSAVLYRALACTGVHWRALACIDVLWCALACSGMLWLALVTERSAHSRICSLFLLQNNRQL
jgi:hypothetical protein